MCGAVKLHSQTRQQQANDDADDRFLLPRQPVHAGNVAEKFTFGKPAAAGVPS
jgi:hypothetical protein